VYGSDAKVKSNEVFSVCSVISVVRDVRRTSVGRANAPGDACVKTSTCANSMSLVRFERNDYSVPVKYAHQPVVVKGYVDRIVICRGKDAIAVHRRLWTVEDVSFNPLHYLELLERKPGALDQENILRIGKELANRLHENDIGWWDEQLHEYEALPNCEDFSKVWDDICHAAGADPDDYGFWLVNTRSMQYAWGSNAAIPMMAEAAKNVPGFKGVLINRSVAEKLGIHDDDIVKIESVNASVRARAVLREGVRPDTVVFTGQFGHWKTPFARELGIPNLNALTDPKTAVMDSGGSSADVVKVRIRKA